MGRYGLGTRVAMVFVGSIWTAVGVGWLYFLFPGFIIHERFTIATIPTALVCGGLLLLKSGLKPAQPKTFEEEKPDAHPDLDENVADAWCE